VESEQPMTSLAVEWATLSTPQFVAWTRLAEVAMPFPLNTGAQPYIAAPDRAEIERTLEARKLIDSVVLAAARAAFAEPRLCVYAVRVAPDGTESKFVAVAGRGEEAVLVILDQQRVAVRRIGDADLAASVVGSLPSLPSLNVPTAEVPLSGLQEVDAAIESGVSPRIVHLQMGQLGFPPALIALRVQSGTAPATSGVLGAVAHEADGTSRHSTRSASWRELDQGALLQVERGVRQGTAMIMLTPLTPDALFRAAVDAIGSVYESRQG
jgi:hypothetical protein